MPKFAPFAFKKSPLPILHAKKSIVIRDANPESRSPVPISGEGNLKMVCYRQKSGDLFKRARRCYSKREVTSLF